jgi:hypothetical protein
MFTKSSILSAGIVLGLLGGAVPALAGYNYDGLYGGPHQTWCDVNPDCNGWNKRLNGPALSKQGFRPGHAAQPEAPSVAQAQPRRQRSLSDRRPVRLDGR